MSDGTPKTPRESGADAPRLAEDEPRFKVQDRRHWSPEQEGCGAGEATEAAPRSPSIVEDYRLRTEAAEKKLLDYIEAFKEHQRGQDEFRSRLARDVERRVDLRFGELVAELLQGIDDLDLALSHVSGVAEAEPLARGVALARDRFLAALERQGVTTIAPEGQAFDPNESEALRVDPVDKAERDGVVTETLQLGYRLSERVLRPARVAVGRYVPQA